jgi:OmpA-OmpF porin, OOP family
VTTGMNSTTPRRLAGAVIAALAAYTGSALAQTQGQVTSASGGPVVNASGEPWKSPFEGASASPQVAQAGATTGAQKRITEAPSARRNVPASTSAPREAFEPGYVEQPDGANWRTASGECWRAGHWTPQMAAEPCDAVAVATTPPPPVAVAPQPAPAPAPRVEPAPLVVVPAPEPRGPMIQKITLETDVLFGFDKAELRPEGQRKLDEIADGLKGAEVNEIVAIGHTDPIGNEQYNEKLSQRRADAVKEYLAQKGVSSERIQTEGRGEQNPVTGDDCRGVKGQKLISCLEPNRRVEIEVFGQREVAATETQPGAGATSSPSGSTSGGSAR